MLSAARCFITTLDSPLILQRPLAASSARGTPELASSMRPIDRIGQMYLVTPQGALPVDLAIQEAASP